MNSRLSLNNVFNLLKRYAISRFHNDNQDFKSYIQDLDCLKLGISSNSEEASVRVLFGPSFSIYSPSFALDRTLAYALEGYGFEIIPVYCDGVQETDCNCVGGHWGGGDLFQASCNNCENSSKALWRPYGRKARKLSQYLTDIDKSEILQQVNSLTVSQLITCCVDNISVGLLAKDILVNNYLVASLELVPNHHELLKIHVSNLLRLKIAYERLLDDIKPHRVVANDSFYGMWALMEHLCKKRNIPYYSHWPVTNDRAAFAYNDAAMNLNFREAWDQFSEIDLTDNDKQKIDSWLSGQRGLTIDTTKPAVNHKYDQSVDCIKQNKPTLILAPNIIWDLAALNKQIIFNDMIAWINETIEWFVGQLEFQLVIKPHPAETAPSIPVTRETVENGIKLGHPSLPSNVILLRSDTHISFNKLLKICNVKAIAVHTTTPGYEFAAKGYRTITTAKAPYRDFGFTYDPSTKGEYFSMLTDCLNSEDSALPSNQSELAQKFLKLYQFHYYLKHDLFIGNPPRLNHDIAANARSRNNAFGYIIEKIVSGQPIVSANSWPPES